VYSGLRGEDLLSSTESGEGGGLLTGLHLTCGALDQGCKKRRQLTGGRMNGEHMPGHQPQHQVPGFCGHIIISRTKYNQYFLSHITRYERINFICKFYSTIQ